jgi:hypothetical protein
MQLNLNTEELLNEGITHFDCFGFHEFVPMLDEMDRHTFTPAPERIGLVRQHFSVARLDMKKARYTLRKLFVLQAYLRKTLAPYLWQPLRFNEAIYQSYPASTTSYEGITRHRDESKFFNLVCLIVLQDGGQFYYSPEGIDEKVALRAGAGSLIVMSGSGFSGKNFRVRHGVQNITTPRATLGLRQC